MDNLADVSNSNVGRRFPEVDHQARQLLDSGVVPPQALGASTLGPGNMGFSLQRLPTFSNLHEQLQRVNVHGAVRSRTPFLVENFPAQAAAQEVRFELAMVPGGENVQLKPAGRPLNHYISDAALLKAIPSWMEYDFMHNRLVAAMLSGSQPYLHEHELDAYAAFMRVVLQLAQYFAGNWLAFLRLERELRLYQHAAGVPWDMFFGMLNPLQIALAAGRAAAVSVGASAAPSGSGASSMPSGSGAGGQGKGAKSLQSMLLPLLRHNLCFKWFDHGSCPEGDDCKYAADHRCMLCKSTAHGTKGCPRLASFSA